MRRHRPELQCPALHPAMRTTGKVQLQHQWLTDFMRQRQRTQTLTIQQQHQRLLTYFVAGFSKVWFAEAGFVDAFCPTQDWVAQSRLAIDQGPIVIGLENYRSGLVWRLVSGRPEIQRGLRALGFTAPYLVEPAIA